MGMIHELLPALKEAEDRDKKVYEETAIKMKKQGLLDGYNKVLIMHDEDRKDEEVGAGETHELTTTVIERLNYMLDYQARNMDAQFQRELANRAASADVSLPNGKTIKDVPATYLMWLEKYLVKYRNLLEGIPTQDTSIRWIEDKKASKKGTWISEQIVSSNKTEKNEVPIVMYEATDKHPAQVKTIVKNTTVGHYENTMRTGKWTPHQKHQALNDCDQIIEEVKRAKSRANKTEAKHAAIGKAIIGSILEAL